MIHHIEFCLEEIECELDAVADAPLHSQLRQHIAEMRSLLTGSRELELSSQRTGVPAAGPVDDLTCIRGIDAATSAALAKRGISSFCAIADWRRDDIAAVEGDAITFERVARENWIEQAALLADGHMTRFVRQAQGGLSGRNAGLSDRAVLAGLTTPGGALPAPLPPVPAPIRAIAKTLSPLVQPAHEAVEAVTPRIILMPAPRVYLETPGLPPAIAPVAAPIKASAPSTTIRAESAVHSNVVSLAAATTSPAAPRRSRRRYLPIAASLILAATLGFFSLIELPAFSAISEAVAAQIAAN